MQRQLWDASLSLDASFVLVWRYGCCLHTSKACYNRMKLLKAKDQRVDSVDLR